MDSSSLTEATYLLAPPIDARYPDKATALAVLQAHGRRHGYNLVMMTASASGERKRRQGKVELQCDRGGPYRTQKNLTPNMRKRKREARVIGCPFHATLLEDGDGWFLQIQESKHNHGPVNHDDMRDASLSMKRVDQITAEPYLWPHDASFGPMTTALVIIDMQRDFCEAGGYLDAQGYSITDTQALIPKLQSLLDTFRSAGFPIYHTREGHRPDLSTLSTREKYRSRNNASGLGIGDWGPLGRLLIRGEAGHDIVAELYPLPNEPVIDKPGRSAFAHTDFELLLHNRRIRNLVIAGVTTDVCVSSTMREANDRGFDCVVLEDGTCASDEKLHTASIESVRMEGGIFGATAKLEDIINAAKSFQVNSAQRRVVTPSSLLSTPDPLATPDIT